MKIAIILSLLAINLFAVETKTLLTSTYVRNLGIKVYDLINSSISKETLAKKDKVFQNAAKIDSAEKNFESESFLKKLISHGSGVLNAYTDILTSLNAQFKKDNIKANCFAGPLKKEDRVKEKLEDIKKEFPGKGYTAVTDIVRGSCVAEKAEDVPKMIAAAEKAYSGFARFRNKFNGDESGYRDCNTLVTVGDHLCELQFHLKAILDYKEGDGHKIYEQTRKSGTSEEDKTKLKKQSKDGYDAAYKNAGGERRF